MLTASEVEETAGSIADVQRHDGMIPWSDGGHCDPWNHTEAAMGLTVGGFHKEALLAYQWLADSQLPDGSWFNYYLPGVGVKDPRLDTNVCAYVATGAWHHFRVTGDGAVLSAMWPMIDRPSASSCGGRPLRRPSARYRLSGNENPHPLTRRKRRRKTSIGWRRWSNAYLYDVLKLYWDWKIHPFPARRRSRESGHHDRDDT